MKFVKPLFSILKNIRQPLPDFGTGLVESPVDTRDYLLSSCAYLPTEIPDELPPLFRGLIDIHYQGTNPSCVGHASAHIKSEKELRERNRIAFDGEHLYAECKKIDGLPNLRGTFFRTALKVLQKQGAMPQGGGDPARFKIGSYALVDDASFEGLKKAICVNGYLLSGYRGSNAGWKTAYVRPPKSGEAIWGHAIALVGYTKDYLIGVNSWGSLWGANGYFYIPRNYVPIEAWAILADLPTPPEVGVVGWVAEMYLKDNKVVPEVGLNLRRGVGTNQAIIKLLPKGTAVEPFMSERVFANGLWWIKVRVI